MEKFAGYGPHAIALELARIIAQAEGHILGGPRSGETPVTLEYILKLYSDCIRAVGSYKVG